MELIGEISYVECPEPVEGLSWVYILLMCNDMLYVGQTHDVAKRIARHAAGTGARQTRQLKEFTLVYVEGPMESDVAIKRERHAFSATTKHSRFPTHAIDWSQSQGYEWHTLAGQGSAHIRACDLCPEKWGHNHGLP